MFFQTTEGDRQAPKTKTERLYYMYRQVMFTAAKEILKDEKLSEDAVNEAFIRVMRNLHKIDESDVPKTRSFLVTICRNVARDMCKKKTSLYYDDEIAVLPAGESPHDNPEAVTIQQESYDELTEAIQKLKPIYRDVFLLRNVYHMSREEIAKLFDISVETVKKRLVRAKTKVREELKKGGGSHEQ